MKDLVTSLVDKVVKIDRGGPESRVGKILSVSDDFFTLLTEDDGVVYYKYQHVKSITDYVKKGLKFSIENEEMFEVKEGKNLREVLDQLMNEWVDINRGGPEKIEGVLQSVNDDYLTLVSKEEVVRIALYHLRNISHGLKPEKTEEQSEENNSSDNQFFIRNRKK